MDRRLHDGLHPLGASDAQPAALGARSVPVPRLRPRAVRADRGNGRHRAVGLTLAEDLALATRAARVGGDLLLARFRTPAIDLSSKSSRTDMVSAADRESEEAVASVLVEGRPDDGVLTEEHSADREGGSGRRWVVDPLDGTTNFLYGLPAWCVSVALEESGTAVVGVVHDAVHDETFTAIRDRGAHLNGAPLRRGDRERSAGLATALVATGFGYDSAARAEQGHLAAEVLPRVRDLRRGGSAALDICWLAAGRLDGYYERGVKRWDWAAARLIAEEAGCEVRDLPGDPHGLVATRPSLIDELNELVMGE